MTASIAILGCGHMGSAMAQGILSANSGEVSLILADPNHEKLNRFTHSAALATDDSSIAVRNADTLILAVKPQDVENALKECADHLPGKFIISVVAGIPLSRLSEWLPPDTPVVRCMPNTPSLIGVGITGSFANKFVTSQQMELSNFLFQTLGEVLWLDTEDQLHAVTALSGSGPAYFFYVMDAMIEAGSNIGLERATAARLVTATAHGAARMVQHTKLSPRSLKEKAITPRGTTKAALESLNENQVHSAISAAVESAYHRSITIAKEF